MIGQLQDAGNTTTLAHYLELLTGAGILTGLQKFGLFPISIKNPDDFLKSAFDITHMKV